MASGLFKRGASLMRSYGNGVATRLDKIGLEWLSRKVPPREGWTKNDFDEIQLQIPIAELKTDDIQMLVDANNKFLLREKKLDKQLHIQELPLSGKFAKAHFKSTMEDGLVTVNIKNFRRNQVDVKFTDDSN